MYKFPPVSSKYRSLTTTLVTLGIILAPGLTLADQPPYTLIRVIDTSSFPSPDPTGITYIPSENTLLLSDSEINETTLFQGDNVYKLSLFGSLLETYSTLAFSDEPTGISVNPDTGKCYLSDDTGSRRIYVVDPGPDGQCLSTDDTVTSFRTADFSSSDPEDVLFAAGSLFVVEGKYAEIYRLRPGANGRFDGVPPKGDDQLSQFDTDSLGITDPEGIGYDAQTGTLYITGKPRDLIIETTLSGQLVRSIDISDIHPLRPSGVVVAPSSLEPSSKSLYLIARGVDNNSDPNENDGKIYELQLADLTPGNSAPIVNAGADFAISLPNEAQLNGSVTDDGLPTSNISTLWKVDTGAGSVTFADAGQLNTTVTFSQAGTYVLRLTASDGELSGEDILTVNVSTQQGNQVFSQRITAGVDDAEEKGTGSVKRSSSDLELVYDGSNQVIGLRYTNVGIPNSATILKAFVQFQVDEPKSTVTSLTIKGEANDNAGPILDITGNISSRSRTTSAVGWTPVPWTIVGEAGLDQRTPDIASVIQDVVSRPGWSAGNSLMIIISGTGERVAESYNGDPAGAPLLYVEYQTE